MSQEDKDNKTNSRIGIKTSVDMGSYINSTSLVDSLGGGNQQHDESEEEEDLKIEQDEKADTTDEDEEFAPTQVVEADDDNTYDNNNDEFDEIFNIQSSQSNLSDGENKINFKQLVRLKSTLKRHEIPLRELMVEKEIGQGFFGKVYKAKWRGKNVALKKITLVKFRGLSETEIFDKEVSIMSKLCHPTCVMFIGACSIDHQNRSIVMEYMEGGNLRKLLDDRSNYQLSPSLQLSIAINIAEGMNYLHTNFPEGPIIHRDLTSSNILLNGSLTVAKINDFGLSKEMKPGPSEMTAAMGSLAWMAPECFKAENYTEKVDVYSYAVILWEILTCRCPYNDMEPLRMAFLASVEDYRLPLVGLQPYWAQLISQCWHRVPEQRPSFKEILIALAQIEQNPIYQQLNLTSSNNNLSSLSSNGQMKTSRSSSGNGGGGGGYYAQDIKNSDMQIETKNIINEHLQSSFDISRKSFLINTNNTGVGSGIDGNSSSGSGSGNSNFNNGDNIINKLSHIPEHDSFLVSYKDSGIVRYYSLESKTLTSTLSLDKPIVCMNYQIINNKVFLAIATNDSMISIYELDKNGSGNGNLMSKKSFYCGNDNHVINDITWNGTNVITSSSKDQMIKIWDVEKSTLLSTMSNSNSMGNGGILSIDSQQQQPLMASGGVDGKIKLWDIRNLHCFRTFTHSDSGGGGNIGVGVDSIKFRQSHNVRDPIILSSSSVDCNLKVWNMYSSKCLNSFKSHHHGLLGVHINQLSHQIISYSSEGTISLYNSCGSNNTSGGNQEDESVNFFKLLNVNSMMESGETLQSAQLVSKNLLIFSSKTKFYSVPL